MSKNEQRILATEKYYDRDMRKNEQNRGEAISSGVSGSGSRDWADVLRELREASEAYY